MRFQSQDQPACLALLDLVRREIMNCSCSQTVHGYRLIKGLSVNNAYFCINVNNEERNYAQNKDVTAKWQITYLQTNKIIRLESQGDMAGKCNRLYGKPPLCASEKLPETPLQQAQYHQHWGYCLWGKLGEGQKASPHWPQTQFALLSFAETLPSSLSQ